MPATTAPSAHQPRDDAATRSWTDAAPRSVTLVCITLFVGTLLLFGRAASFEFVNIDDVDYVVDNVAIQRGIDGQSLWWAFTSVHSSNWHPLTWISHMVDWQLFGAWPGGHHAVNVLWHALNAVLAFLALRRLTGSFWTSAACAALFAWHPLRAESVAWVSERKDVLSAFFFLLALWSWGGYARADATSGARRGAWYALALIAFALGLLAKAMPLTLPFVLLLLDVWPLARLRLRLPDAASAGDATDRAWDAPVAGGARPLGALVLEKLPFFVLTIASAVATYLAQDTAGATFAIPLGVRLANAVVSVARYLGTFVWPFGLAVIYPYPASWPVPIVAAAALLLVVITAVAWWQSARRPWIVVGWLWFVGMLVPVIGIVQVGTQAMADRYTYLPILGVQIALLWTLRDLVADARSRRETVVVATGVALAVSALLTFVQVGVWRDAITLFSHATRVTDGNFLAHSNLGMALANARRHAEAEQSFRRALEIEPAHLPAQTRYENDYMLRYALAVTLIEQGRFAEAGEQLELVLAKIPDYIDANNHYGVILAMRGEPDVARSRFELALRYQPNNPTALYNLAHLDLLEGRLDAAIAGFRRSIAIEPSDPRPHCGLASALAAQGDDDAAARSRAEARRLLGDEGACPG